MAVYLVTQKTSALSKKKGGIHQQHQYFRNFPKLFQQTATEPTDSRFEEKGQHSKEFRQSVRVISLVD